MEADAPYAEAESGARAAWERKDFTGATDTVFSAFGGEIYSFLLAQFRGQATAADDVFSAFSEDFWRALPNFEWRCSIRAWCYRVARSAASRHRRSPQNRRARQIPLSVASHLDSLVERTRTITQTHLRTEVKDKIRALRESLSRDEQDLLILRVDRALSWRDVAHVMLDSEDPPEASPDEARCQKLEAALRQRFAEVKKHLKSLAQAAGLV